MPKAYYNEFDPFAAQWLQNLIAAGHIAPGEVDQRSIEDVRPSDLAGFTQCHFFAGVGVWSYALRRAGWPDSRPVWTGSCPCQPFSTAGKGDGFSDERHLWPAWFHLIGQRNPVVVFGEQVASKDAGPWVDLVHTDLEALGYAFGAVPFPSAGVGAPHIRDRLYWVADSAGIGSREERAQRIWEQRLHAEDRCNFGDEGNRQRATGTTIRMADLSSERRDRGQDTTGTGGRVGVEAGRTTSGMADDQCSGLQRGLSGRQDSGRENINGHFGRGCAIDRPSPTNGFWRDADWLGCRDGKWRPVEPGTFPLAHGAPARVGRLRGYGNAINAEAAIAFITSYLECQPCP